VLPDAKREPAHVLGYAAVGGIEDQEDATHWRARLVHCTRPPAGAAGYGPEVP
jgi:hypothetical protein